MNIALVHLFKEFPEFSQGCNKTSLTRLDKDVDIHLDMLTIVLFGAGQSDCKEVGFVCYNDSMKSKYAGSYAFASDFSDEETASLLESMMRQALPSWAKHKQTIKKLLLKFCDKEIKEERFK